MKNDIHYTCKLANLLNSNIYNIEFRFHYEKKYVFKAFLFQQYTCKKLTKIHEKPFIMCHLKSVPNIHIIIDFEFLFY